jgi:hypothetical protein
MTQKTQHPGSSSLARHHFTLTPSHAGVDALTMDDSAVPVSPMEMDDDEYNKIVGLHKPGSIKRVKMKNFLTYDSVEFTCGPRYERIALLAFLCECASFIVSYLLVLFSFFF